jgi:alginate O-acetyltransferase complex protein AlgI
MTDFHEGLLIGLFAVAVFSWVLPKRYQMDAVALITMLLLGWFSFISLILLSCSSILVYLGAHNTSNKSRAIGLLITYCGTQFLILRVLQLHGDSFWQNMSFLGLTYYTCRHIHYLIECYAGRIRADARGFWHYQFFWPVMITGPIHRYNNFHRQCQRRRWNTHDASFALNRVLFGYAKVIILANYLVAEKSAAMLASLPEPGWLNMWLSSANDWIYLYLQFSGWSDIAIGFALLMGIKIEENFDRPFVAKNLIEFWKRWHITLSSWCREYVFTPIVAITRKPFLAVSAAMITMGLWHEVSVYYLLWGLYHASGIAVCRVFQNWQQKKSITVFRGRFGIALSWFLTMFYIVSGAPIISSVEQLLFASGY